jgi:hypothetical protein
MRWLKAFRKQGGEASGGLEPTKQDESVQTWRQLSDVSLSKLVLHDNRRPQSPQPPFQNPSQKGGGMMPGHNHLHHRLEGGKACPEQHSSPASSSSPETQHAQAVAGGLGKSPTHSGSPRRGERRSSMHELDGCQEEEEEEEEEEGRSQLPGASAEGRGPSRHPRHGRCIAEAVQLAMLLHALPTIPLDTSRSGVPVAGGPEHEAASIQTASPPPGPSLTKV